MKSEDIKKLADLARIDLSEEEIAILPSEINSILGYVEKVSQVASSSELKIENAGIRNVTRSDVIRSPISEPETLIGSAPASKDGYVKVRKIL